MKLHKLPQAAGVTSIGVAQPGDCDIQHNKGGGERRERDHWCRPLKDARQRRERGLLTDAFGRQLPQKRDEGDPRDPDGVLEVQSGAEQPPPADLRRGSGDAVEPVGEPDFGEPIDERAQQERDGPRRDALQPESVDHDPAVEEQHGRRDRGECDAARSQVQFGARVVPGGVEADRERAHETQLEQRAHDLPYGHGKDGRGDDDEERAQEQQDGRPTNGLTRRFRLGDAGLCDRLRRRDAARPLNRSTEGVEGRRCGRPDRRSRGDRRDELFSAGEVAGCHGLVRRERNLAALDAASELVEEVVDAAQLVCPLRARTVDRHASPPPRCEDHSSR